MTYFSNGEEGMIFQSRADKLGKARTAWSMIKRHIEHIETDNPVAYKMGMLLMEEALRENDSHKQT